MRKDRYKIDKNEKQIVILRKKPSSVINNYYSEGSESSQPESIMGKPVVTDTIPRAGEVLIYNGEKKRWEPGATYYTEDEVDNFLLLKVNKSDGIVDTYERHIQIAAVADGTVANQPTDVDFFTAGGLQFGTSAPAKYAFCQWEIPDDWDGGDIYFEVDWMPDSGAMTAPDTVKWDVEYRAIAEGEAINNGTSVTVSYKHIATMSQYQTYHSRVTLAYNSANQPLTNQDHIYFKITRDYTVADDFGGTVTILAYEIIYNSVKIPRV